MRSTVTRRSEVHKLRHELTLQEFLTGNKKKESGKDNFKRSTCIKKVQEELG